MALPEVLTTELSQARVHCCQHGGFLSLGLKKSDGGTVRAASGQGFCTSVG